jgi:sugar transferase (PEP-CTERM/EpsH1 system associated)
MVKGLAQWATTIEFDSAVAFSVSMAPYVLAFRAKRRVLDLCDVDSEKWLDYGGNGKGPVSRLYRAEGRRLRTYERACLERFDATLLVSEREREILDPGRRCEKLHVIPNGTTLYAAKPAPASATGPVVGFVGAMDYRPNVEGMCWFVEAVWPRIVGAVPEAELLIVGRRPTRRVRRLGRERGVRVTGEVEDVRRHVARFRVMVAPLRMARGLQNKVLEAMAMRRPVVATSAVAGGLQVADGHNILVADEPEAFAERVIALCQCGSLCDKIGDGGYRCVATYYSWAETLQRYERLVMGEAMPELTATRGRDGEGIAGDAATQTSRVRSPYAAMLRGDIGEWREQRGDG